MRKLGFSIAALVAASTASTTAFGALYTEDFNVDNSANWTVNDGGTTDILVDFNYDYSAIGVPSANGGDTTGLKMTANNSTGVFGGFSVSPTGENFGSNYTLTFDMWQNYAGPVGPGGSGTTQISLAGVGTSGTSPNTPGQADGVYLGVTLDGGSSSDFRAYSSGAVASYPSGDPVYAPPGGGRNGNDPYYTAAFPGGVAAPAAQVGLFPGQAGVTDAGEVGFEWRQVVIDVAGNTTTMSIDGVLIATVDTSALTLGGSNILLGHSDSNNSASSDPNRTLLNVTLIDNVVVTPEPASLALMGLGGIAMLRRR